MCGELAVGEDRNTWTPKPETEVARAGTATRDATRVHRTQVSLRLDSARQIHHAR